MKQEFALTREFVEQQIANFNTGTKCDQWHQGSCNLKFLDQAFSTAQSLSKLYLMVHLIPFLLKIKKMKNKPMDKMIKFITGYIRSLLFAGLYSGFVRRSICLGTQLYGYHNYVALPAGFIGGISLMFQTPGRQAQIALYCLSKTMETSWSWLARRNYVKSIKYGDALLFGIAIAILGFFYQHQKQTIKPTYLSVVSTLLQDI